MPYQIIIDSANQIVSQSTSNSDFKVKLQTNFFVTKSSFKKIVLPFSWYPIDSTNNSLSVTDGGGTSAVALTQPSAWTGAGIASMLQTALNADATLSETYTVTYNSATAKFTIAATGNFTLLFATSANTIYRILGFSNSDSTYTGAATYTSTNVSYVLGPPYVIVKSQALTSQAYDRSRSFYSSTTSGNSPDQLLIDTKPTYINVPVNVDFGGLIVWNEGDFTREVVYSTGTMRSDQLFGLIDLQLVNPWTDAVININGANWCLELEAYTRDN